ncbi:MAG: hypothetical protein JO057_21670 [Chloroflexi bacterium]|nr:hypothetical protein [Chloroflexota bacterium]
MLTPGLRTHRRAFLHGIVVALAAGACTQISQQQAAPDEPTATTTPQLDAWHADARGILQDGLRALRTFDDFVAYRVSTTPSSGMRSAAELVWDPPTGAAWDDATHVAHGMHGRADQLFQAITTTQVDQSVWREQRAIADIAVDIRGVGDALAMYRDRLDELAPGDTSGVLSLLDRAWTQWAAAAARLGLSRTEAIACAAPAA